MKFNEPVLVKINDDACEIAMVSPAGIVCNRKLPVGGKSFDECIAAHIKRAYHLVIGSRTAEEIKVRIGSACPLEPELTMEVKGRDYDSAVPKTVIISSEEIRAPLQEPLSLILESLQKVLERCPPELSASLTEHGILLTGNGAMLRGLDQLVCETTKLPVHYDTSNTG